MSVNSIKYNPVRLPAPFAAQYKIDGSQPIGQKESFALSIAAGMAMSEPHPINFKPVDVQDKYIVLNVANPHKQYQIESVLTKTPDLKFEKYV